MEAVEAVETMEAVEIAGQEQFEKEFALMQKAHAEREVQMNNTICTVRQHMRAFLFIGETHFPNGLWSLYTNAVSLVVYVNSFRDVEDMLSDFEDHFGKNFTSQAAPAHLYTSYNLQIGERFALQIVVCLKSDSACYSRIVERKEKLVVDEVYEFVCP